MFAKTDKTMFGGALIALLQTFGLPALADEVGNWNSTRAKLFSQVCMRAAPTFEEFGRLAQKAGFRNWNGELLFKPEVVVSLQQDDGACRRYMTVGAPDQTAMVSSVFERLIADYPDAWKPTSKKGVVNNTVFLRDGVEVRVALKPFKSDGKPWISANATVKGACPT